jgi:hypothetical protein
MWPSGDWGEAYEEGLKELGVDINATYDDDENKKEENDDHNEQE